MIQSSLSRMLSLLLAGSSLFTFVGLASAQDEKESPPKVDSSEIKIAEELLRLPRVEEVRKQLRRGAKRDTVGRRLGWLSSPEVQDHELGAGTPISC